MALGQKGPRVLPRGPSQLLLGALGRIGRSILGRCFGLRCGALFATVRHRHHRGAQDAIRHAVALLVHVVDGLVVLRSVLDTSHGLVNPQRSGGNTRLYSRADIERLELINQLTDEGINLAGVVRILDMKERAEERERENEKLRARVRQLEDELHEYKMQKKITALAPRDGSVNPEQVMRKLLGAGGDL